MSYVFILLNFVNILYVTKKKYIMITEIIS